MRREDAVMASEEETKQLNYLHQVIRYIMYCYKIGKNVYYVHNGEKLYSCDGYTFDEYYILATGISLKEQEHWNGLFYGEGNRSSQDRMKLSEPLNSIYSCLIEINKPLREELRRGRGFTL